MAIVVKRGITEEYWGLMSEDKKLGWECFSRTLALVIGLFVTKTGITAIDLLIGAFAAFTPLFIIRSQRTSRKYSPRVRKGLLGAIVFLGSTGAVVLGLLYFGIALLSSVFQTYMTDVAPLRHRPDTFPVNIMLCILVAASLMASVRVWRGLQLSELIFDLPKRSLKQLVLQRKYMVQNFSGFAHFELSVQLVGFMYSSICAEIVKFYWRLFFPV